MLATDMFDLAQKIEPHRSALFGLCYRMTGCAADAEDLVQDTFRRALERPPADLEAPLKPWLVRVATNLCIDALRHRRAQSYIGPWLPSPVPIERVCDGLEPSPEARVGLAQSATLAFLCALEALEPRPRAVLVLRDVLGMTGPETAEAVGTSAGNVRVILHRARAALEAHRLAPPTDALKQKTAELLRRLSLALASGDVESVLEVLAEDVTTIHDAGGEFIAAVRPLRGAADVARFYRNIQSQSPMPAMAREVELNGLPALVVRFPERPGRYAERITIMIEVDDDGRIAVIRSVIASRKLTEVDFGD